MFKTLNRDNSSYDRRFYERFTGDWRATRGLSSPGVGGGAAQRGGRGGGAKAVVCGSGAVATVDERW